MRGEITTRRLQVLIDGLGEGSALHRAAQEGKNWSLSDAILWQILGQLTRANLYWRALLKIPKHKDKFEWPKTPWDEQENQATRYGDVAPEDQDAAVAYLMSLHNNPQE